jgi:hypothetical protein
MTVARSNAADDVYAHRPVFRAEPETESGRFFALPTPTCRVSVAFADSRDKGKAEDGGAPGLDLLV